MANRSKLLRLFADFKTDKGTLIIYHNYLQLLACHLLTPFWHFVVTEDEQFEADKAQVVREIASLEPRERP